MTQNFSGVEPVKAGGCEGVSLDLPGLTGKAIDFTALPDPIVAERFESAMGAMKFPETSASLEMCGLRGLRMYDETCETDRMGAPLMVPSSVARRDAGALPETVGRDVPIAPQTDVPQTDTPKVGELRRSKDTPPYQSVLVSQDASPCQDASISRGSPAVQSAPQTAGRDVVESPRVVGRDVPIAPQADVPQTDTPKVDVLRRSEDTPPYQSVSVARNTPPYQGVVASRDISPYHGVADTSEQVQIIAPAQLPIELPAAAVQQQKPSAPVTPSDVTRMFVAAAEAVADAILVSSGFANGEGRLVVRLRPEVLNGSEVQIVAKGGTLTVVVNPATQDVQTIIEANRTQFEQHLAEKVHSWRVSVAVRRGEKSDERV